MRNHSESIGTIIHPNETYVSVLTRRAGALLDAVLTWQERARQRHAMATMDEHALKDIGLSRSDVVAESTKPFWRG
jgi:uncharacterized protein YjiS (DUF1127 family)